ncbi:MAG: carbonic anhydrase [Pirellulales bacterium]
MFAKNLYVSLVCAVVVVASMFAGTAWGATSQSASAEPKKKADIEPAEALAELQAGNQRFITSSRTKSTDTSHDAARRHELNQGQHPIAAVLCCADSRVSPEFIFDQAPGTLFEIRNAGNVVDDDVIASIEYAVEHLHVPVVVVMGHYKCGAIQAVHDADGKPLPEHLAAIQLHMKDLEAEVHELHADNSQVTLNRISADNAVAQTKALLAQCKVLREAVEKKQVRVVTMEYDLESGEAGVLPGAVK